MKTHEIATCYELINVLILPFAKRLPHLGTRRSSVLIYFAVRGWAALFLKVVGSIFSRDCQFISQIFGLLIFFNEKFMRLLHEKWSSQFEKRASHKQNRPLLLTRFKVKCFGACLRVNRSKINKSSFLQVKKCSRNIFALFTLTWEHNHVTYFFKN